MEWFLLQTRSGKFFPISAAWFVYWMTVGTVVMLYLDRHTEVLGVVLGVVMILTTCCMVTSIRRPGRFSLEFSILTVMVWLTCLMLVIWVSVPLFWNVGSSFSAFSIWSILMGIAVLPATSATAAVTVHFLSNGK